MVTEIAGLEKRAAASGFWDDQAEAQRVLQRRRRLQEDVDLAESLRTRSEDLDVLFEWAGQGESVADDLAAGLDALQQQVDAAGQVKP